jgi:hypothetical protein
MSAAICREFGISLLCYPEERESLESGDTFPPMPQNWFNKALQVTVSGEGYSVSQIGACLDA